MRRSRTAALKIGRREPVDDLERRGARTEARSLAQDWTSDGRIDPSGREPKNGTMWRRRYVSTSAAVDGRCCA